ncbi:VanW family protein [Cohnella rhizosphaerae]|uniref:VanW family protein n=1 Tax=Cohnella rhizosphaerae TaxID=1457232 RepID=A0A9X4KVY4_9BACL|nr:VanW family protein [Cohnella rhizosphaerae]MDG0811922.1 VanW family protein [Cohnella rhizosphaerae]
MDNRFFRIAAAVLALILGMNAGTAAAGAAFAGYGAAAREAAGDTAVAGYGATARETAVDAAVAGYGAAVREAAGDAAVAGHGAAAREAAVDAAAAKHGTRRSRALPADVSVGGLAMGGMSADAAIAKVRARIEAKLDERVTLVHGHRQLSPTQDASGSSLSWRELGLHLNAEEAIKAIMQYRDAGWLDRRSAGRAVAKRFPIEAVWDEEMFAEKAEAMWGSIAEKASIDAVRAIDAYDRVVYSPEKPGETLDLSSLLAVFKKRAPAKLGETAPAAKGPLAIETRLPVVPVQPEIKASALQAQGIARKIAEFSTSFAASGEGRVHNVKATADALDDTVLLPGETFDYGAVVAKARRDYGYRAAPVILKGKLVPGIGGGICQVSSTLYNAVLRASGLKIVERRNHSLPVNYLPQGMDATFAEGSINFRFRNDTGKRLLIKASVRDKRLTVKLFGTMADNVRYELEAVLVKELPPRTVYRQDAGIPVGLSRLVQAGKSGAVVDTYRLKYVEGRLAARSKLNRSIYRAQDAIFAVNPADARAGRRETPQPSPQGRTPAEPM